MPEIPTLPDDEPLLAQLRAWADDLAEQVPPVAAPTAERGGPGRIRILGLAAAVVVVLGLAAVVAVRATDHDEDVRVGTTTTAAPSPTTTEAETVSDLPLEGPTWWLETVEVDGAPRAIPLDVVAVLGIGPSACPQGDASCQPAAGTTVLGGHDGCNGFSAEVTVAATRITGHGTGRTLVGCEGERAELSDLVRLGASGADYTIEGDVLTLRYGTVVATYRAGTDDGYPAVPDTGGVLAEVEGEGAYRATWEAVVVGGRPTVRARANRKGGVPPSAAGAELSGADAEGGMAAAVVGNGAPGILVGLVDARATVVTYRWGDTVVEVPTVALDGVPGVRGFTAWVDAGPVGWRLWATAADGTEVATFVHRP